MSELFVFIVIAAIGALVGKFLTIVGIAIVTIACVFPYVTYWFKHNKSFRGLGNQQPIYHIAFTIFMASVWGVYYRSYLFV